MRRALTLLSCSAVVLLVAAELQAYPKPSVYPISWQLKFEHGLPQRIVVSLPDQPNPRAFWYMTYTVTNASGQEQVFLPVFEMLSEDGRVVRSDKTIPLKVFEEIKKREGKPYLEQFMQIGGQLRIGDDQAREGVAIWPEPSLEMGHFSIFVTGLSGEATELKDEKGQPVKSGAGKAIILRKTLQLNFFIRGDEVYPGEDEVNVNAEEWVMR